MTEPAFRQRAVRRFGVGQFAYHLTLGACVREHIDEVKHDDVELILLEPIEVAQETLTEACFIHFVIGEGIVLAVALDERLDHRLFVEVLPFFALLVDPQLGEHLSDIQGHQPGEDRIAGVLRRRR